MAKEVPEYMTPRAFREHHKIGRTRFYKLLHSGLPNIKNRNGVHYMIPEREAGAWLRGETLNTVRVEFEPEYMRQVEAAAEEAGMSPEEFIGAVVLCQVLELDEGN